MTAYLNVYQRAWALSNNAIEPTLQSVTPFAKRGAKVVPLSPAAHR
jgi:hypothetical protein